MTHADFERRFAALDIIINTEWTSPTIKAAVETALCNTLNEPNIEHQFAALDIIISTKRTSSSTIRTAAESVLCTALKGSHPEYRVAAIDVLATTEWSSPVLAQALIVSWYSYAEPVDLLLDALNKTPSAHFRPSFLPFRKAMMHDTSLWRKVSRHAQWRAIITALYLPDSAHFSLEVINRDSPLTEQILDILQSSSTLDTLTELQKYLVSLAIQPGTALARDAVLALTILGNQSWVTEYVVNAGTYAVKIYPLIIRLIRLFNIDQISSSLELHSEDPFYQPFLDNEITRGETLPKALLYYMETEDHTEVKDIPYYSIETLKDDVEDLFSHIKSVSASIVKLGAPLINFSQVHDTASKLINDFHNADMVIPHLLEQLRVNRNAWGDQMQFISKTNGLLALTNILRRTIPACIHITQVLLALIKTFQEYRFVASELVIPFPSSEQLTFDKIEQVVADLTSLDDIQREKAQKTLVVKRHASTLGKDTVEQIARSIASNFEKPQTSTYLEWALQHVVHDQPDWIAAWIEQSQQGDKESQIILRTIYDVTPEAFLVLFKSLQSTATHANLAILKSLLWLTRCKRIPEDRQYSTLLRLFGWLDSESEADTRRAIIKVLGHWQKNQEETIRFLLKRLNQSTLIYDAPVIYMALARLTVHKWDFRSTLRQAMEAATPQQDAAAALVYLQWIETHTPRDLAHHLDHTPLKPEQRLTALLDAGSDDDVWKPEYHECLVKTARIYVEQHKLLVPLLMQLEQIIEERDWTARRFATAVLAACIEAMPSAVQYAYNGNIEALLVKATKDANSSTSRRFAIRALSYLRTITPSIVPALLAGCRDTKAVQKDTIVAASRFLSIKGDILTELASALTGESATTAYAIAHLLGSLGVSTAASDGDLRQQIIKILVEALKIFRNRQDFVLSDPSNDNYDGVTTVKLEEALHTALLQCAGWTG